MYERISKSIAEKALAEGGRKDFIYRQLRFGGISEDYDFWVGKKMLLALLFGVIGFLIPWTLPKYFGLLPFGLADIISLDPLGIVSLQPLVMPALFSVVMAPVFMAIVLGAVYLHLYYMIEGRTRFVEEILPDFLLLVASHINAGMTPFSAFRNAARKEFGPLSEEIKIATSKSLGTQSFSQALKELSNRLNSRVLKETIWFFSQAMRSGGKLSKLLETTAFDLRQTQEMKEELYSSTRMYVMFVAFVVVIGAPMLLSISIQFLDMISEIQAQNPVVGGTAGTSVGFLGSELSITSEDVYVIAYALLMGNAILASMFMGVLNTGKPLLGVKYTPAMAIASIIMFFIARVVLSGFFVI